MAGRENEKDIEYPAELTFKSVFRSSSNARSQIEDVLSDQGLKATVKDRESSRGKFISFTITASFPSAESLRHTCDRIASINGFMTMF